MADEMMVLLRFGGDADDLLPRYLGAVKRWRAGRCNEELLATIDGRAHEDRGRIARHEPVGQR